MNHRTCDRCGHEGAPAEVGAFLAGGTAAPQKLCHDTEACAERQRWVAPKRSDERRHYMVCGDCGQEFDMRDLGVVLAHELPHDGPLDPKATPIVGSFGRPV